MLTGGKVLYLQGEINVSNAGPVRFQLDSAPGSAVVGRRRAGCPSDKTEFATTLAAGRHTITLRVDTKERSSHEIKVEVTKPAGSPAEFTVVGGQ